MNQQLDWWITICWLFLEANINEAPEVIAELTVVGYIRRILVFDLFKHLKESSGLCVWVWTCHKFYKDYSKTPNIAFERIFFSFHSLWAHVVHCSYKSSSEPNCLIKLFCDTEICQLDKTLTIDQYVVQFDISVHLFLANIEICEAWKDHLHHFRGDCFWHERHLTVLGPIKIFLC